ncbi:MULTISPECIES: helix-turn-helix transcriptional regulator [unclassified Sphingobacterium]|uniref:helix-turn-helix transcriptional regulator n=1 Tax=unclassified Sphingobacterium TaxID=2609468 RepID=UPI0025CEE00E|nr:MULTISPECIES: AraC family transcriptional regulator [unclassified Sphingobacterium]
MSSVAKNEEMSYWVDRLGVSLSPDRSELEMLELNELKMVDLLPEMLLMIRSVVAKQTFCFRREPIKIIENGVSISFQNIIHSPSTPQVQPHVRIVPLHVATELTFPKAVNIQQVTILVSLDYLKSFIGKAHRTFDYLFDNDKTLWIEEFMSPEIAAIANEIAKSSCGEPLSDAFYRLKSLELLFHLFKNLSARTQVTHQQLTKYELESIYRVRDQLANYMDRPFLQEELVKISGMNVIKLRKLFTQVFGMGMYPYYQRLRMQEAGRLLRDELLSVSETGYRLGFSNLSYFGRLFESHFGSKPKKWMQLHKRTSSGSKKQYNT